MSVRAGERAGETTDKHGQRSRTLRSVRLVKSAAPSPPPGPGRPATGPFANTKCSISYTMQLMLPMLPEGGREWGSTPTT
jgi:hypothetical protein